MPPGGFEGYASVLEKYGALYRVMAQSFAMSAPEVNRMMPWEVAAQLDIKPEVEGVRRIGRPARPSRPVNPREERATPDERAAAVEFRRALVAAAAQADD